MLANVVVYRPEAPYPVWRWVGAWCMSVGAFVTGSFLSLAFWPQMALLAIPTLYLFAGWGLNRIIYDSLHIDPYHRAATVEAVLATKAKMLLGWWHRWPRFILRVWLAQLL